ncbi:hypothetical protein [Clostridioides difficile]|uniref:hypothetical protein n=1 Tax=Clostridioides difficile TaxID=1496 RepID=UPI00097FD3E6|nr:hypothetical protein [Clostridioides difficile]MCA0636458.1 hypothetical protein [Clostridioides difficile]MCI9908754.1 hypothetical protein [Clostridioides difficile]MCK8754295.1 hypothetical protein [Clostridioides difficile]MCO8869891.1 hypothetical protein [Clostridioides difficile]MCO8997716.1 hypothetical protein [Clostridioides difficile]
MNEEIDNRINKKEILERYVLWVFQNLIDIKGTDKTFKFWSELRRVSVTEGIDI